jgi:hypothetical protein
MLTNFVGISAEGVRVARGTCLMALVNLARASRRAAHAHDDFPGASVHAMSWPGRRSAAVGVLYPLLPARGRHRDGRGCR